jgi:hypothetical protein
MILFILQVEVNTFVVIYIAFVNSLAEGGLSEDAGRSAGYILAFLTIVVLVFGVSIVSYAAWTAGQARLQRRWSQSSFHFGGHSFKHSFKKSFRGSKSSYRNSKSARDSHSYNRDQDKVKEKIIRASDLNSDDPLFKASADGVVDYPEGMRRNSRFSGELAFDDNTKRTLAKMSASAGSTHSIAGSSTVPRASSSSDKLPDHLLGFRAQPTQSAIFAGATSRASMLDEGREDTSGLSDTIGGTRPSFSFLSDSVSQNESPYK